MSGVMVSNNHMVWALILIIRDIGYSVLPAEDQTAGEVQTKYPGWRFITATRVVSVNAC